MNNLNGYDLSRAWFDFCFENPEDVKPNHTALYFFCIEHCNRLGWKQKFGLPTTMVKDAIGIRSYNTYINTLNDLVKWGFIKMIERSKNQYSSNIIALSKFNKALDKALDKALIKHGTKQSESTVQSIDSIIKQINNKQYNKEQLTTLNKFLTKFLDEEKPTKEKLLFVSIPNGMILTEQEQIAFSYWQLFKNNLQESGIQKTASLDKADLYEWTNIVRLMYEKDSRNKDEFLIVWHFLKKDAFWKQNIQSMKKLREKFETLFLKAKTEIKSDTMKRTGVSEEYLQKLMKDATE